MTWHIQTGNTAAAGNVQAFFFRIYFLKKKISCVYCGGGYKPKQQHKPLCTS